MTYPYGEFGGGASSDGPAPVAAPRTELYSLPGSGELLAGAAESLDIAITHLNEGATHLTEAEQTSRETGASLGQTLEGSGREGELEEWVFRPLRLTGDKAYDRTVAFYGMAAALQKIRAGLAAA